MTAKFLKSRSFLAILGALALAALVWLVSVSSAGLRNFGEKGSAASVAGRARDGAPAGGKTAGFSDWENRIAKASAADFPGLMLEILAISDPGLRAKVAAAAVGRWVSVDLDGFIAFIDATEVDDDGDASALWAVLAPALATALPSLPDDVASRPELAELVRRLIEYVARQDPEQAWVWARQWLLDDALESALATIAGEMIKKSPEQAKKVLAEIHSPARRVDALGAIGVVYGNTHPGEATAWARTLESRVERPYAMNAVLSARAESQPHAAAVDLGDFQAKMAADYSAERNAEIARLGLKDIPLKQNGEPLTPEEAMDSETLPPRDDPQSGLLDDAAKAIAENWAAQDPAAAAQWAQSLPTARQREEAVDAVLAGWASNDPQAAFDYFVKSKPALADPAEPIFEAWAAASPAAATAQVDKLLDRGLREKAVSGVVSGWLDNASDRAALQAWVDKLPYQSERDIANRQIADVASSEEPQVAWQRATAISSQSERREVLKSAFVALLDEDPAQARTLLASATTLTPDEVKRLNTMLNAVSGSN